MIDPQLSVVIPAYNNWWLTRRCLLALDELGKQSEIPFETIVVDNASTDETQEGIQAFPSVQYLRQEKNLNYAGGCNLGAKVARGAFVLFLNNDAVPVGDPLTPLVRAFEDPKVCIAGARVLFEDGPVQAIGLVILSGGGWWTSYRNLPSDLPEVLRGREIVGVNGAAYVVDRKWFESVGGFDEGYVNGSEDVDLFMQAAQSGRSLRYVPEAVFHHYEGASPNRYDYDEHNLLRFAKRWKVETSQMPRVKRGGLGAFMVLPGKTGDSALDFALEDLMDGLRQFGHPIARSNLNWRALFDKRFREAVTLEWFYDGAASKGPTVSVSSAGPLAQYRTHGVEELSVPWLPCALPQAGERCAVSLRREAGDKKTMAVVNVEAAQAVFGMTAQQMQERFGIEVIAIDDILDVRSGRRPVDLALLHGLTDSCGYGNLALAHAGIPIIIADTDRVRNVYSEDTACIVRSDNIAAAVSSALQQPEILRKNAERMRADALRRFSVRRAAMRLTDLARVARNGFERGS